MKTKFTSYEDWMGGENFLSWNPVGKQTYQYCLRHILLGNDMVEFSQYDPDKTWVGWTIYQCIYRIHKEMNCGLRPSRGVQSLEDPLTWYPECHSNRSDYWLCSICCPDDYDIQRNDLFKRFSKKDSVSRPKEMYAFKDRRGFYYLRYSWEIIDSNYLRIAGEPVCIFCFIKGCLETKLHTKEYPEENRIDTHFDFDIKEGCKIED